MGAERKDRMTSHFQEIRALFDRHDSFVLATHVNADGDGLGAQFALASFLRRRGKKVRIVNVDPLPRQYDFMARGFAPELYDPARHDALLAGASIIVILDNSSANRLGAMRGPIERSPAIKACIDHHPHPDTQWDVMVIDEKACATGEIVYRLIREADGEISPEEALPIYVSIVTDTGNFRFSNTTPQVLTVAADLVGKGVDVPSVYQQIFERNSPTFVRLLGAALASIQQDESGQLGWIVLSRELMRTVGADGEDTSDIINGILTIDGTRLAAALQGARGRAHQGEPALEGIDRREPPRRGIRRGRAPQRLGRGRADAARSDRADGAREGPRDHRVGGVRAETTASSVSPIWKTTCSPVISRISMNFGVGAQTPSRPPRSESVRAAEISSPRPEESRYSTREPSTMRFGAPC